MDVPWGTAGKHWKARPGICRKARQRNAARRSPVEFPEKTRTHPLPRALARSPAVGSAHSHAAAQTLPCPRARNAPDPQRHSGAPCRPRHYPEWCTWKRWRRGPDGPKEQSMGAPREAAEIGHRPTRKAPKGASWLHSPKNPNRPYGTGPRPAHPP